MIRRGLSIPLTLPLICVALSACGERAAPESDTASTEYPREVFAAHMKDHFFKAVEMQVAVINADLGALREPAEWMAKHANSAAMPKEWSPHAEAMHNAALEAAEATDLESAAVATATMATECGNCHQALGAEVGFAVDEAPPAGDDAATHMSRHAWASGRMWEGMIMPSGVVWDGGAEVLAEAPLAPADIAADIEILAEVSALEESVHALGAEAVGVSTQTARASLYGQFLTTCASCHEKTGRGPI